MAPPLPGKPKTPGSPKKRPRENVSGPAGSAGNRPAAAALSARVKAKREGRGQSPQRLRKWQKHAWYTQGPLLAQERIGKRIRVNAFLPRQGEGRLRAQA